MTPSRDIRPALAHYAGQSAGLVSAVQPGGIIVQEIAEESVQAGQALRDALAGSEALTPALTSGGTSRRR